MMLPVLIVAAFVSLVSAQTESNHRVCAGCPSAVDDLNTVEIRRMSWDGARKLAEHAQFGTGQQHWVPVKIESAEVQVVSGILHRLTVIFGQSACVKTEVVFRFHFWGAGPKGGEGTPIVISGVFFVAHISFCSTVRN